MPTTMRGWILVLAAALPAAAAVSARRVLPGRPLRAPLRHEHHHSGRSAAARLSTPLFGRHSDGRRTAVPAPLRADRHHTHMSAALPAHQRNEQHGDDRLPADLHSERQQHAHQHHRGPLSATLSAALHDRPGLPDDCLPSRPAVPTASSSVPHLQR